MSHKLVFFPALLVAACVFSAVYGALHCQITYTLSPRWFASYQFGHFHVPIGLWNRAGAALVGVYSTWWMGLVIGPPLLFVGLILPGWKAYLKHTLVAFGVVAWTALLTGLGAMVVALFLSTVPDDCVETMTKFGYHGGYAGIVTGLLYLILVWRRIRRVRV